MCRHISHLERWLRERHQVVSVSAVTPAMLVAADKYFCHRKNHYRYLTCAALHRFLRQRRLIPEPERVNPSPLRREVGLYEAHLREVRGLSASTIKDRCRRAASFLKHIGFEHGQAALSRLRHGSIERFIKREAMTNGRAGLCQVTSSLRGFLRFEFQNGRLPCPLHAHIDTPLVHADEKLPPVPTRAQVQALLRSIDQESPHGLRDFSMFYLVAAFGLRSSEVVALTLDDIDWRNRILRIRQVKTRRAMALPLTDDVGKALARYLKKGRPRTWRRHLFLKSNAPAGPLSPVSVGDILQSRLRKGGLDSGRFGVHAMRHSLAVHLLRRGASMKSIGDTLGHRSIRSTATYLRLNPDDLRTVGLPVPPPARAEPLLGTSWRSHAPKDPNEKRGGGLRPRAQKRFRSAFARDMERFLTSRRTLGRKYRAEEFTLQAWDAFLDRKKARAIDRALFDQWAQKQCHLSQRTQYTKLNVVRRCLVHAARFNPRGFVPNAAEFPKCGPIRPPRLVSASEMSRLLATAGGLHNGEPWRIRSRTVQIGLTILFCCGLRVGELLRLKLRHFEATDQLLRIEYTKFNKSRLVPLTPSVAQAIEKYLEQRRSCGIPSNPENALIWCGKFPEPRARFSHWGLSMIWKQLCLSAGIVDQRGLPPRLHDLRHSFACEALHRWYERGDDPQSRLPHLAAYLGHAGPTASFHYLHLTPSLRVQASHRFHTAFGHLAKAQGTK
jgi:site-specific recombinase XerD